MIQLDGSVEEGGGAILRTALALSTLTGKPFEIINIRKNRPKPGLKQQHMHAIIALEKLTGCSVTDCEVGSEKLTFIPGEINRKFVNVEIGTAGSMTLVMQSLLLPIIFSGKTITIKITGGTDVKWSVPIYYFSNVFLPHITYLSETSVEIKKRGYYPKGGGEVYFRSKARDMTKWEKFEITNRAKLLSIRGVSHASSDLIDAKVADRQAEAAKVAFIGIKDATIQRSYTQTDSPGSGITIWAVYSSGQEIGRPIIIGADSLGEKGKKSEDVGREAAEKLKKEMNSDAAVDSHLADMLIPYMAVTKGRIKTSEITSHIKANIYVAEKFLNTKFRLEGNMIIAE